MPELITRFDQWIFLKINSQWTASYLDQLFVFLSEMLQNPWLRWLIMPTVLILYLHKYRSKIVRVFAVLVLTVAVTDSIGYYLLKKSIARPRPHHTDIGAIVKVGYGPKSKSFPSNHALNSFAMASVLSQFHPGAKLAFYTLASLVAYSRVYVGVHWLTDVLAGAFLGILLFFLLNKLIFSRIAKLRPSPLNK